MPERKIAAMTGMHPHSHTSPVDHHPHLPGMTEEDTRKFLREEQAEGMHPSLKGKRF